MYFTINDHKVHYDALDDHLVSPHQWALRASGDKLYAYATIDGKQVSLHQHLTRYPKGVLTDHRNGDSLDNRRDNLRPATTTQNCQNKSKGKNNTSGFKGVYAKSKSKTPAWIAQIYVNGKFTYLGSFSTPEDAARAYDAAALKYFGDFAKTNFETEETT